MSDRDVSHLFDQFRKANAQAKSALSVPEADRTDVDKTAIRMLERARADVEAWMAEPIQPSAPARARSRSPVRRSPEPEVQAPAAAAQAAQPTSSALDFLFNTASPGKCSPAARWVVHRQSPFIPCDLSSRAPFPLALGFFPSRLF